MCHFLSCRHQIPPGHPIGPLHEAGMENRIQVLKGPFNILQLAQDKRSQFPSPGLFTVNYMNRYKNQKLKKHKPKRGFFVFIFSDTTVTVSIATVPNYPPVKTEVPTHGFSVTVPNNCAETDSHVAVFDRQLAHNTPPDSTFSESFKDGSQEVSVSIPLFLK